MTAFYKNDVNVTKIESKTIVRSPHSRHVRIDFEGTLDDPKIEQMLTDLRASDCCHKVIVLNDESKIQAAYHGQYTFGTFMTGG